VRPLSLPSPARGEGEITNRFPLLYGEFKGIGFNPALQRGEVGDHLECNERRLCRMIGLYDMGSDQRADRLDGLLPNLNDRLVGLLLPCLHVTGDCVVPKSHDERQK
jgi:hypothetical protein